MSQEDIESTKAPLMEHLIELRSRLIKALIAFGVMFAICFVFARDIYNVLVWPFVWVAGPENSKFIYTALLEYFITQLKLAMFGAAFLSFPIVASQIYMFVAPGLYKHERKAFLPYLIASGDGHVINISSVFGLFAVPGQAAYNAAKFAVRGFTEALRQEMVLAGHPVGVTTVHPGGIKTAIARNGLTAEGVDPEAQYRFFDKRLASTTPQRAAEIILEAVRKNKARVLVGQDAIVLDLIVRITGSGYQRLFAPVLGRMKPPSR